MKRTSTLILAAAAALIATSPVMAQPHDDHRGDHGDHGDRGDRGGHGGPGPVHSDWHQGGRIQPGDWNRGQHVDYQSHHLRRPPHGYEWRQVDGNYVLAAAATGLIAGLALAH